MTDEERYQFIRNYPSSGLARVVLRQLVSKAEDESDRLTSVDVPRLRTLAELLSLVAPHEERPHLQAQAKEMSAMLSSVADDLEVLGADTDEMTGEAQ